MSLSLTIGADLKAAMKARDAARLSVLRMTKAALDNKRIDKHADLDDAEELAVVRGLVRQREDSVAQFRAGGRNELADKEESEIAVLRAYLPVEASDEEIAAAVARAVEQTGAAGPKDLGRVMKAALAALREAGKPADGRRVNEAVRARLGG